MAGKLRPKYYVTRFWDEGTRGGPRMESTNPDDVDSPFVLMPRKDPAAFLAMICYAQYCEPNLRAEIATWLTKIAGAEPVFGTQGRQNYEEIRARSISLGL